MKQTSKNISSEARYSKNQKLLYGAIFKFSKNYTEVLLGRM
jgi:hypothetical protein